MSSALPGNSAPAVERGDYETAGGFQIGDDVEVTMTTGRRVQGRVMGPADPFVQVMIASSNGYGPVGYYAHPTDIRKRSV